MERALLKQLADYGLATAEIHYYMPDHPSLCSSSFGRNMT